VRERRCTCNATMWCAVRSIVVSRGVTLKPLPFKPLPFPHSYFPASLLRLRFSFATAGLWALCEQHHASILVDSVPVETRFYALDPPIWNINPMTPCPLGGRTVQTPQHSEARRGQAVWWVEACTHHK
jgi:hypothetical protein